MTTGKTGSIDRSAVVAQLNRAKETPNCDAAAAVPSTQTTPTETLFAEPPRHATLCATGGQALSCSASASTLWGQSAVCGSKPPLAALGVKNLSQAQAQAKRRDVEKQRREIADRIACRVHELDKQWNAMPHAKKCEALRKHAVQTAALEQHERDHVHHAINCSETADAKLTSLRGEARRLERHHATGKKGSPEERSAMAQKLVSTRKERKAAVDTATKAVDDLGLKVERLAAAESVIDPSGGADSDHGSLLALVDRYFELTFIFDALTSLIDFYQDWAADMDREAAEAAKRKQIDDAWLERNELMRRILAELQLKILQKDRLEADTSDCERPFVKRAGRWVAASEA